MATITMNEKKAPKVTKAMRFAELLALTQVQEKPELVAFIEHEVDLLSRKNSSGEKKPTKNQVANEHLMADILDKMEAGRGYTITEVQKEIPEASDLTNQKISALMRKAKTEGLVVRDEVKGKPIYTKVEG